MKYKLLILLILVSLLFTACSTPSKTASVTPTVIPTVLADDTIVATGRVEPIHYAEIAFSASGVVSEILVQEGQSVKTGQPLIHLGNGSDTNYAAAQLELVSAQKALDDLIRSRDADLAQATIDLKDARETYDKADNYLTYLQNSHRVPQVQNKIYLVQTWNGYEYRYKSTHFKGPAPQDWIIEAENDLALKKAELEKTQRTYDALKDGPDAQQLPLLQARLNAAKAGVAAFEVVAPFDGVVAQLHAKAGSSINAGETAIIIADFSSWIIKTTDVTEIDVVNLREGQPVTIKLDAIPDKDLKGTVLSIGQNYSKNQGDIVYEVTVLLTDTNPVMRWGMTAEVRFGK